MAERNCEECGESTQIKHLGKIHGEYLCKKCRASVRKEHRKETKNQTSEEEREKIRELSRIQKSAYNKAYHKRTKKETVETTEPKIKGSKITRKKPKSNAYLSIEDKRQLLRILIKKGLTFEEAKNRMDNIMQEQSRIRAIMKEENKSEDEIKIKQKELLEELWNY